MILDGRFLKLSDSIERLLDAWLTTGIKAFERHAFHGFVVAWNADNSECVLVRDPFGFVSGYAAEFEHGVVFSTDLTTLIRFGTDSTPNSEAIDAFFATGSFPAPLTPVSSISKLPPGHLMSITANGLGESVSWFRHHTPEPVGEEEALELLGIALHESLRRTWLADGDAGLLLSGGVDSAMILVGVTRMLDAPIRAFTFRYEGYEGKLNEGSRAKAVAEHLGVPHEEIPIRPEDILNDLEGAVAAYDEPFTWGFHSYQLGPLADRGIASVFSGGGADGWSLSRRHVAAMRFNRLPRPISGFARTAIRAARPLGLSNQQRSEWVSRSVSGLGELYSSDSPLNRHIRRRLYRDPTLADRGAQQLVNLYQDAADEFPASDPEQTLVLLGGRFGGAETALHWSRAWTLAYGLELRLPYYDHDLLNLVMNIEGKATGKDLLRRLAARYLPNEMAIAPRTPQQMPVSDWLRGPLSEPARERLADMPKSMTAIFDPVGVTQLVDEHIGGSADHGWRLIALLTTAAWFDQLPS
jgi:asparagine synthase (glutamine-hydrolysing)